MNHIDAKGKACPMPVMMAKKEMDTGCEALDVLLAERMLLCRSRHIQLPQRRLMPVAPMVTAGQDVCMIVQRQVDPAVTALHRDRNTSTYIRTFRRIYTYRRIFRTSYSCR